MPRDQLPEDDDNYCPQMSWQGSLICGVLSIAVICFGYWLQYR